MTIAFPRALLRERSHSWNLAGVAFMPGQNALSVASVARSDGGGFWICSMADVQLSGIKGTTLPDRKRQRAATLLWRAVRQVADGGVVPLVVPRNDALFRPWPAGVPQGLAPGVPHSDGTLHSDDTGYYTSGIDIAAADVDGFVYPRRSTTLRVDISVAAALVGGESFSILHPIVGWRLYEIATVDYLEDTLAEITFMPPLREAVAPATPLEFDRPRCVMRLGKPSSMDLAVAPWTFNQASVDFIEAFV
jgi:hypothetical protein